VGSENFRQREKKKALMENSLVLLLGEEKKGTILKYTRAFC
jgi:hypothetical protein